MAAAPESPPQSAAAAEEGAPGPGGRGQLERRHRLRRAGRGSDAP